MKARRIIGALLFLAVVVVGLEIGVRVWKRFGAPMYALDVKAVPPSELPIYEPHPTLVFAPKKNGRYIETRTKNGSVVYSAHYDFDGFRRRLIPIPMTARDRRFLLFFGCSYTFGHGVEALDTIPARFGDLREEFRPYVYAVNGYGPQQTWRQAQEVAFRSEVTERTGEAVYIFFDHHLQRLWGSMKFVNAWGGNFEKLAYENGKLASKGPFSENLGTRLKLYHLLNRFRVFDLIPIDLPVFPDRDQKELFAHLIQDTSDTLKRRIGSGLTVVIFPGSRRTEPWASIAKAAGIRVLDYSGLYGRNGEENWIRGDGHPSPEGYRKVAEKLAADF